MRKNSYSMGLGLRLTLRFPNVQYDNPRILRFKECYFCCLGFKGELTLTICMCPFYPIEWFLWELICML